jgi:hypothetical protein
MKWADGTGPIKFGGRPDRVLPQEALRQLGVDPLPRAPILPVHHLVPCTHEFFQK